VGQVGDEAADGIERPGGRIMWRRWSATEATASYWSTVRPVSAAAGRYCKGVWIPAIWIRNSKESSARLHGLFRRQSGNPLRLTQCAIYVTIRLTSWDVKQLLRTHKITGIMSSAAEIDRKMDRLGFQHKTRKTSTRGGWCGWETYDSRGSNILWR